MLVAPDLDAMAVLLKGSPDFRVLRRFVPRAFYEPPASTPVKVGLFVDVETTGLDTTTDKVIELALVPFEFDHCGKVYAAGAGMSFFNDPGKPIPPEITALTGITDEQVQGKRIDEVLVLLALSDAALVVAHNADFDRKMCEQVVPAFAGKPWACSFREVEWESFGCVGGKLVHILEGACGEFYDGHEALADCRVGVHVLASATHEGRTALSYLLESARQPTVRVWAVGAPFSVKDSLKARKYHWADGTTSRFKAWYRDVRPEEQEGEKRWLRENAFVVTPQVETFDATTRYSTRAGA